MSIDRKQALLMQCMLGSNLKVKKRDKDKILVTCNIATRQGHQYLWGAEKYCMKICHQLAKKYEVHLFQQAENFLNCNDIIVHPHIYNFFSRSKLLEVAFKASMVQPRCILCNAGTGSQALFWTIVAKIIDVPIIMFLHNEPTFIKDTISPEWGMYYVRGQTIMKDKDMLYDFVLDYCDELAFLLPQYIDSKYKDKTYVYLNCIDIPNNVDVESDRKNLLYVGRINTDVKRTQILLDWVKNTEYACKVCGYNYQEDGYLDMNQYQKYKNINFLGYHKNMDNIYRESNVLVIPSLYEGLPTVALEALSYGIPIVGFKECKSMNDIIQDGYNGWLVDNNFSDVMEKVMSIKDMRQIRKNCLNESKKYDINNIMKTIFKSIEDVKCED